MSIAVVFALHKDQLDPSTGACKGGELLYIYYLGLLVILPAHLILDVVMIVMATRGTIVEPRARRFVPLVLYVKLLLHVPELAWTVMGTYGGIQTHISTDPEADEGCAWSVVWAVRGTAIVGWLVIVSLLLGMFVVFDPLGKEVLTGSIDEATASKMWERR